MLELDGFVIIPPISKRDEDHKEEIIVSLSYQSFGRTPTEAWKRYIHPSHYDNQGDFSVKVQRCHDRGYRVKPARLIIDDN